MTEAPEDRESASPARKSGSAGSPELLGSIIDGRYRVLGWLGGGGMGEVYEIEHLRLGRRFALKALRKDLASESAMVERFRREAQAVARLVSEHVVSIVDSGLLEDGVPYFVTELLRGQDLRRLLTNNGPLPFARVAHLGVDVCRGLAAAHAAGLVHRDLKPENLFVVAGDDARDICKILDFGVVKSATDNNTRPGALIGTTRYMAPEQVGLELALGSHTDLYALGVILYECLTGKVPFDGDTVERVLFRIMNQCEQPLTEVCPQLPAALAGLIHAALSKRPEARPATALAFAEALLPFTSNAAPRRAIASWTLDVVSSAASRPDPDDITPPEGTEAPVSAPSHPSATSVSAGPAAKRQLVSSLLLAAAFGSAVTWVATKPAQPSATHHSFESAVDEVSKLQAVATPSSISAAPIKQVTPASTSEIPGTRAEAKDEAASSDRAAPALAAKPQTAPRVTEPANTVRRLPRVAAQPSADPSVSTELAPPKATFDPKNPYAR